MTQKTTHETKQLQTKIITYLKNFVHPHNIIILESPPLLTSPVSDILPYNSTSHSLAHQLGVRFAQTLVGEEHIWRDGYHLSNRFRHLLTKSVAAAAADVNPHHHFGLFRPPHGPFGPWVAPVGQGMLPFSNVAAAQPIQFRRNQARNSPPLNNNIRGHS